jgi:hypothetical protein
MENKNRHRVKSLNDKGWYEVKSEKKEKVTNSDVLRNFVRGGGGVQ